MAAVPLLAAGPAQAAPICPDQPNLDLGDAHMIDQHQDLKVVHIRSVQDVFDIGQSVPFNNQSSPYALTTQATATSSTTFTLSNTSTLSTEEGFSLLKGALTGKTTQTNSTTVSISTMTGGGTTVGVSVPAWGRLRMDRGVDAVDVVFDLDSWEISDGRCWYQPDLSPHDVARNIPTTNEGWRPVDYPIITPGSVVNAQNFSPTDIRAGTTVAMWGQFFPQTDRVLVQQGGNQWTLQNGSAFWYDGNNQINVTLPADLQPGGVTINVISRPTDLREDVIDLQSNTVSITAS
ncbi:MAG: hypothetical protein V7637_4132 [Mycobacteriales bacterium]